MNRTAVVLALAAVILLPALANAEILFTTGAPGPFNGGWLGWGSYYNNTAGNNILARPFTVGNTSGMLEEIHFWGLFAAPSYPVYLDLYTATAAGEPVRLKKSWFVSESLVAGGAFFHIDEPGRATDGLKYGWTLPKPIELAAGTTYSLAIYGAGQPGAAPKPIYWLVNTPAADQGSLSYVTTDGGSSWEQFDPGQVGLGDQFGRTALELIGSRASIPEPTTMLFFGLGVIPILILARRKKQDQG